MNESSQTPKRALDDSLSLCVCSKCQTHLGLSVVANETTSTSSRTPCTCSICLGLWDISTQAIQAALQEACLPYGGLLQNKFHLEQFAPTVAISGDVYFRYRLAVLALSKSTVVEDTTTSALEFHSLLKKHTKQLVLSCIPTKQQAQESDEGCLCLHVVLTLGQETTNCRPNGFSVPKTKIRKKRFRGKNQAEIQQQGGDPRVNLEERLGDLYITTTNVESVLDRVNPMQLQEWTTWFTGVRQAQEFQVSVTAWRRPFYVKGMYTKSQRNVSQTPFYVVQNGKSTKLGVSSVEEEICPKLTRACRGISTQNNSRLDNTNTVYGMIKFHASGREDMDVRMLLPPQSASMQQQQEVGGRPFCCQVIDAYYMPTKHELEQVVKDINHTAKDNKEQQQQDNTKQTESTVTDQHQPQQQHDDIGLRRYGRNPVGVDVSFLKHTSSFTFRNLQAETEEKVKHYGCLCWCQEPLTRDQLQKCLLGSNFPLRIQQETPIRVLHRRTNTTRTRRVLSLQVWYIKPHWFRLSLSTDAGTYVKEFVHGDLGRTNPSVATLLQCKTDILELDCEGIDMGGEKG